MIMGCGMNNKVWHYLELAGRTAQKKDDDARSYWIGALGIRGDGAWVTAANGPAPNKTREVHAEYRLARKLDHGAVVYVARVRMCDGSFANARPCAACRKVLRSKKVKKVYYTRAKDEFGIMYLDGTESYHGD